MKFLSSLVLIFCSSILFFCSSPLLDAKIIEIPRSGDYAKIEVTNSMNAVKILTNKVAATKSSKKKIANQIENNPGAYNPAVLLSLCLYYMEVNEIEKSAFWCRAAIFRTAVDVRIHNDPSLKDIIPIFLDAYNQSLKKHIIPAKKEKEYVEALAKATKKIIQWDIETPRGYDDRWVCLHSVKAFMGGSIEEISIEQKEKIIEEERKHFIEANKDYL